MKRLAFILLLATSTSAPAYARTRGCAVALHDPNFRLDGAILRRFRVAIPAVAGRVGRRDADRGEIVIAAFNQDGQIPNRHSPEVLYRGDYDSAAVARALQTLDLAWRPGGRLADADFNGALAAGVNGLLAGRSGILWFVTNNKNSPNNSQEVVHNTRAFAEALRSSQVLPYIVAYPLRMPVKGKLYSETGLIIYGIAYGNEAAEELRGLVRTAPLTQLFRDPPVQLKQLDQAPLVFTPQTVTPGTVTASPLPSGGVWVHDVPADGVALRIRGTLRSDYYPQVIEQARATLRWDQLQLVGGTVQPAAELIPGTLHRLAPKDVLEDVTLVITIPEIPRPPGFAGLLANGDTVIGVLAIELDDLTLTLQDEFSLKLGQIAALDQLPDVFLDYRRITVATTRIPIQVDVRFSMVPLLLTLGALVGAILVALAFAYLLGRSREYTVRVADRMQRFRLRPFRNQEVRLPDGRVTRVTGTVFGSPRVHHNGSTAAGVMRFGFPAFQENQMQHDTIGQWQLAQAQPPRTSDFQLRSPNTPGTPAHPPGPHASPTAPAAASAPAPALAPQSADLAATQIKPVQSGPYATLTPTAMVVGGAIMLGLVIVFVFISRSVRSYLIGRRASPSSAGSAGWALFAFLLSIATTAVFGFVGSLWAVLAFIIPMGALTTVTLILFVILFNSATRISR